MTDPMRLFFQNDATGLQELPVGPVSSPNTLPSTLIVAPAIYTALGYRIDMRTEGLYCLSDFTNSVQCISYASDINALKVAVANLSQHGVVDDGITSALMMSRVAYRTISRTCGGAAPLANTIFGSMAGIPSRIVNYYTMQALNSYDNGHTLVEIKVGGVWQLFDGDMKFSFLAADGMTPLNMVSFADALAASMPVTLVPLSDGAAPTDTLFNYVWLMKSIRRAPLTWYARMAGICSIGTDALCDTAAQQTRAATFSLAPMSRSAFLNKYYS